MSAIRIGAALDISDDTVRRALNKLEKVGLIERRRENQSDTAIRSVDEWNEWFMADKADLLLSMKTGDVKIDTVQYRSSNVNPPQNAGEGTQVAEGGYASCVPILIKILIIILIINILRILSKLKTQRNLKK